MVRDVPACIDGYPHISVSRSVYVSATRKEATESSKAEEKVIYETDQTQSGWLITSIF